MGSNNSRQCVILVGGRGTRLGALTQDLPKPLLPVGGRPFLAYLVHEVARHGVRRVLLLAGFKAEAFNAEIDALRASAPQTVDIRIVTEAEPLGTAGAVKAAAADLDDEFLLMNGDSFFDLNLLDLMAPLPPNSVGRIALRSIDDIARYGAVTVDGERVTSFSEKGATRGEGLINGGVYWFRRSLLDGIGSGPVSLETDVLPGLAAEGRLLGRRYDGFFIDIGVPDTLRAAQTSVPAALARPLVVLSEDGDR